MWTVIGILAILLALGFLVFKRNLVVLRRTEKDLKELKDEFAAYRQTTRLAREKAEMDHFNAIKKLKGQ
jgi:protein-S-isoprenylcysteine O-methyltransferase Ste14